MENQYYTLMEKQDFYDNTTIVITGDHVTMILRRDERLSVLLENIDEETKGPLAEAEFVLIVELEGAVVNRTYGVPVDNVEDVNLKGRRTRADEIIKAQSREELIKKFGAVKIWSCGKK